jgi:hypothetical protein
VASDDKITIDGLPMKRTGKAAGGDAKPADPIPPPPKASDRPSDSPGTASAKPPPSPPPPPTAPPPSSGTEPSSKPSAPSDSGDNLFASILASPGMSGMFAIALKDDIPEEAKSLTDEADRLFGNSAYSPALVKFKEAQKAAGGPRVEFLHRIGRCHLKLNEYDEANDVLKRALKLDPANAELKKDYKLASEKSGKTAAKVKNKSKGKGKGKSS